MKLTRLVAMFLAVVSLLLSTASSAAAVLAHAEGDRTANFLGQSPGSVVGSASKDQSARGAEWAKQAASAADEAAREAEELTKMASSAGGSSAQVLATVQAAKEAARKASEAELRVRDMRDNALHVAREAAFSAIPAIVADSKKEAREKAKQEAKVEAGRVKTQMIATAATASQSAMKPYADTLTRASAVAAQYQQRANEEVVQSSSLQAQAQMAQSSANQYVAVGNLAEGEKLMQQSRQMSNIAVGLNTDAKSLYDTAHTITQSLPAYSEQAQAAAYHASAMMNPDAPPPLPPLVLAQKTGK